jgi:excinuclease ABC subunit A
VQFLTDAWTRCTACDGRRYNRETLEVRFGGRTIAEVLEMSVSEAAQAYRNFQKLSERLNVLESVGLGYLRLGQAANTLSGGEAQRLKLSLELARRQQGGTLYLLDEPTTGLHWVDIQKLTDVLFRLRDAGNTIIIIEHNLDVMALADWVVDIGPGGGPAGGTVTASGPPEEIADSPHLPTGRALAAFLARRRQRK